MNNLLKDTKSCHDGGIEIELDFHRDPRVQWFKERILNYIGMDDCDLFYNMLEEGDTKQNLATLITAPIEPNELSLEKKTFYISKIIVDKVIHEDKEFTEWSKWNSILF